MESASSDDDGTARNTTTAGTDTHENKNQHNHCNINYHHDIDGNNDESNKTYDDTEDVECACPICFVTASEVCGSTDTTTVSNDIEFVYSSTCGHTYCLPCVKNILLHSSPKRTSESSFQFLSDDDDEQVEPIITMTQNICPICRAELSYFDLKKIYIETDEQIKEESALKHKIVRSDEFVVPKANTTALPKELFGTKYRSDSEDTLVAAFRFPNFDSDSTNSTRNYVTETDGDVDFEKGIQMYVVNTDGDEEELFSYLPIEKFQYLSSTHTFKGWATKYVQLTGEIGKHNVHAVQFCAWMTFSNDFQFVIHGVTRSIQLECICAKCMVPVGDQTVDHGAITVSSYGGDSGVQMIRVNNQGSNNFRSVPTTKVRYNNTSFWGNIYCHDLTVGFSSFHFIEPPNIGNNNQDDGVAFISYEHPMSSKYLPLDDGRPLPSRVFFRNIHCPDQHTFCGSICWEDDYHTTWNGNSRLDFKIKFDTKFMCIHSGTTHSVTMKQTKTKIGKLQLEEEVNLEFSFDSDDLPYVNAGLYDSLSEGMVLKHSHEIFEMNENDEPIRWLLLVGCDWMSTCSSMAGQFVEQDNPPSTSMMVLHIAEAAFILGHYILSLDLKDLPHPKAREVQEFSSRLKKSLRGNPFDLEYYHEVFYK